MNKNMLVVLAELRNDPYFFKSNCIIRYSIPKENENLDAETLAGKITAIWDLGSLGAIKIHNKGQEREPGTNIYDFELLVNQPAFDGIYQRCIKEATGKNVEDFETQIQTKKTMPMLLKELNQFIVIHKISGKQAQFLQLLSDFEPKLIDDLENKIKGDIKDLKKQVKHKIKGSGFFIETKRSKSISKSGTYRLIPSHQEIDKNIGL